MRNIKFNVPGEQELSMRVVDTESAEGTLSNKVIIITAYTGHSGRNRIRVVSGEVIPTVNISRRGEYGSGSYTGAWEEKDFEVTSLNDLVRQIEGYSSVLRMTKGNPVSIVLLDDTNGLAPENVLPGLVLAYERAFMKENKEELSKARAEVVRDTLERAYGGVGGLWRGLKDKTVTAFYGTSSDILDVLSSSPGLKAHTVYRGAIGPAR